MNQNTDEINLYIRLACPDDNEVVVAILTGAARWLTDQGIQQWPVDAFSLENGLEAIVRRETYVAWLDGKIVGTFRLHCTDELTPLDALLWEGQPGNAVYIHKLAVNREYAGRRIGEQMIRWSAEQADRMGRELLRLDCMADNPGVRSYYESLRFTFVAQVELERWSAALYQIPVHVLASNR